MEDRIKGGAQHFLDYREMGEIKDPESQLTQALVDNIKQTLLEQIKLETPNTINYDKAFRIQIKLFDDMNLVGKWEEIPIMDIPLRVPEIDMSEMEIYKSNKPLKFKERIKILLKGRL